VKTNQESIEEYQKKLAPLLKYPEFWELYAECMNYYEEYQMFSEEIHVVMSLEDYFTIKRENWPRVHTKASLKSTR